MNVILNREPLNRGSGLFQVPGSKWQLMEDVKGVWYTESMRGIERGER